MVGHCAFPVTGVRTWNRLSNFLTASTPLTTFKTHLKTELFDRNYMSTTSAASVLLYFM